MTVETETTTAAAARQISEKAAADIKRLSERIPVLETLLTTNDAERAEIEQARLDDAHTLAVAKEQDDKATQAHNDALSYANYSVGLLAESESTRKALEAESAKKEAHRLYEETMSLIEKKEAARVARVNTLRDESEQARTELTACHSQIATIQRIEQQALAELGLSTYERLQAILDDTYLAKKAELREQTALVNIEEARFLDAALAELSPWPDLQAKLQPSAALYKDTVTNTLEAGIAYLDALMAASQVLGNGVGRLACIRDLFYQWRDVFALGSAELSGIGTTRDDFTGLQRRRRYFESALTEYRESKKQ